MHAHPPTLLAEKKLRLKLLVDSNSNRVVYAEVGKEFVDFLFHILSLPVGTVVQLLKVNDMVCPFVSLYKSVESLDSDYFLPNVNKDVVLKTNAAVNVPLLKLNAAAAPTSNTIYKCCNCSIASAVYYAICPGCRHFMRKQMTVVPSQNAVDVATSSIAVGGYVKEMTTFMVMDNLEVKPLSTVSCLAQMNKLNVKDVSAIIEKEVEVGFTEGLAILKASFEVANTVLTSVFLIKKEK